MITRGNPQPFLVQREQKWKHFLIALVKQLLLYWQRKESCFCIIDELVLITEPVSNGDTFYGFLHRNLLHNFCYLMVETATQ